MLEIQTVTKWFKASIDEKTGEITKRSFNHYEEGHVRGDYPKPFDPNFSNQVAWANEKWEKQFTYLLSSYENGKLVSSQLDDSKIYFGDREVSEIEWIIKDIEEESQSRP